MQNITELNVQLEKMVDRSAKLERCSHFKERSRFVRVSDSSTSEDFAFFLTICKSNYSNSYRQTSSYLSINEEQTHLIVTNLAGVNCDRKL